MQCDEAARALYAGTPLPELDLHLSACDECRLLSEDLAQMADAFAQARTAWAPSAGFRVRLPLAPWRRLAIAASLLLIPLAGWAILSVRNVSRPSYDVAAILEPTPSAAPSDRELLGALFLGDNQP